MERYDHHCPWINNCVGIHNHKAFLGFILLTLLYLACSVVVTVLVVLVDKKEMIEYPSERESWLVNMQVFSDEFYLGYGYLILTFVMLTIFFLFSIPLVLLTGVQLTNFCLNKTTMERFGHKSKNREPEGPSEQ